VLTDKCFFGFLQFLDFLKDIGLDFGDSVVELSVDLFWDLSFFVCYFGHGCTTLFYIKL